MAGNEPSAGMFGSGGTASFWKPPSGYNAATGNTQYDVSNISGGLNMLKKPMYQPTGYNPYQFGGIGSYGKTSQGDINNTYGQAMNVASTPIMAQGAERMRSATQGWGGNQMGSAANKEMAMKNAQATGSNLADVGKSIGANISDKMLSQDETARAAEWQQKKDVQTQQAAENFKAAGFTDDQAKTMANEVMTRANAFIGAGSNFLNFQGNQTNNMANLYNQADFMNSSSA